MTCLSVGYRPRPRLRFSINGNFAQRHSEVSAVRVYDNHRIYATCTANFDTFTPTTLFYDPGFSCIDLTFLRADGRQWAIIKDETKFPEAKKHPRLAPAESVQGLIGPLGAPFSPPGLWVEGPTALKIGDWYFVYFEAYMQKHYCAMRSRDLQAWEDITDQVQFVAPGTPERMKHGSVMAVPRTLIDQLRAMPVN